VALKIYRVAIDPQTGLVDAKKTGKLRVDARKERLRKGKPFDQFVASWRKLSPPKEILHHYGHWPEPRLPKYDKPFWGLYA
jgi:acetophenone carboxylase